MRLADMIRRRGNSPPHLFRVMDGPAAGGASMPPASTATGSMPAGEDFGPGAGGSGPRYRLMRGAPSWGRFGGTGVEPPPGSLPVVNRAADRIASMAADTPALFDIEGAGGAAPEEPWYAVPEFGRRAVHAHDQLIVKWARHEGIDPDIFRTLIYAENAHGAGYGWPADRVQEAMDSDFAEFVFGPNLRERVHEGDWRLDLLPDWLGDVPLVSDGLDFVDDGLEWVRGKLGDPSLLPMNIKPRTWTSLGLDFRNGLDPDANIRAGAMLVRRILERIPDPDPAKVGSIYNFAGKETVSPFGEAVDRAYREKPWQ